MANAGTIAFIGFGEAGQAFAGGLGLTDGRVRAFDLKFDLPDEAAPIVAACERTGTVAVPDVSSALDGAGLIFNLVPTDQTIAAATAAAPHLCQSMIWLDGSSSSPGRKREAAAIVAASGAAYIDMAIMAPVHPRLHRTPVLLSGPDAVTTLPLVEALGMHATLAGSRVGEASAIKMIRSVLIKGLEAVTAECFLAARKAGVDQAVLASLAASDPDVDWSARATYNVERMVRHGKRRAAELQEVVATLEELGLPARMSAATAQWEDQMGRLGIGLADEPLAERLDLVVSRLG